MNVLTRAYNAIWGDPGLQPRRRHNAYGGIETLERRQLMSGIPAAISILTTNEIRDVVLGDLQDHPEDTAQLAEAGGTLFSTFVAEQGSQDPDQLKLVDDFFASPELQNVLYGQDFALGEILDRSGVVRTRVEASLQEAADVKEAALPDQIAALETQIAALEGETTGGALLQSDFEDGTLPAELSVVSTGFGGSASVSGGALRISGHELVVWDGPASAPTAQEPLVMTAEWTPQSNREMFNVIMRSNGKAYQEWIDQGIYLDTVVGGAMAFSRADGGRPQQMGVVEFAPLTPGATYQMIVTDDGTHVRAQLLDATGNEIAHLDVQSDAFRYQNKVVLSNWRYGTPAVIEDMTITGPGSAAAEAAREQELTTLRTELTALRETQALAEAAALQATEAEKVAEVGAAVDSISPLTVAQERLQAWEGSVAERAVLIGEMDREIVALQADIAARTIRIGDLATTQALQECEVARIQRNLDGTVESITPTIVVDGSGSSISVSVQGLPAGVRLRLDGDVYTLASGTFSRDFQVPWTGTRQNLDVEILGSNGQVLAVPLSVEVLKGEVRSGGSSGTVRLTSLATANPAETAGGPFTQADLTAQQALVTQTAQSLAATHEEQQAAQATLAALEEECQALERAQIPYGRLLVDVSAGQSDPHKIQLTAQFRAPTIGSTIEVMDRRTGVIGRQAFTHASGMADGTAAFSLSRPSDYGHLDVILRGADGEILDQVVLYYQAQEHILSVETDQPAWNDLETGRLGAEVVEPRVTLARTAGSGMLLHIETPTDKSFVTVSGGGYLSTARMTHEGGSQFQMAEVHLRSGSESGVYTITLYDRENGAPLDTMQILWDAATRTIVTVDSADTWSETVAEETNVALTGDIAQDLAAAVQNELWSMLREDQAAIDFEKRQLLNSINVSETVLAQTQGIALYQASRFFIHGSDIDLYMRDYGSDSANSDMRDEFRKLLGAYEVAMGEIMQAGVQFYLDLRGGMEERAAETKFQAFIDRANATRYILELASEFRISIPSREALLPECKELYDRYLDWMINNNAKAIELKARAERAVELASQMQSEGDDIASVPRGTKAQVMAYLAAAGRPESEDAARLNRLRAKAIEIVRTSPDAKLLAIRPFISAEEYAEGYLMAYATGPGSTTQEIAVTHEMQIQSKIETLQASVGEHLLGNLSLYSGEKEIQLTRNGSEKYTFSLSQPTMVNIWFDATERSIQGPDGQMWYAVPNFSIELSGDELDEPYITRPAVGVGKSISAVLPVGEYSFVVRDRTTYPAAIGWTAEQLSELSPPKVTVQIENTPYTTAEIIGRISNERSYETMPVSMRVAEFETVNGVSRRKESNLSSLDPDKPVWVIIHGRGDSDRYDPMTELAQAVSAQGVQIVTINWTEAASDNVTVAGLQGSQWIASVGQWIGNQLMAAGFKGAHAQNIQLVGHSWGALVTYEVSQHIPGGVRTIVALDPAKDSDLLGGAYERIDEVNFSTFTQSSLAFHSSIFADKERALTADQTFRIRAPENYEQGQLDAMSVISLIQQDYFTALSLQTVDAGLDAYREHGFAVTLFVSLLNNSSEPDDRIASLFQTQNIVSAAPECMERDDDYEGVFWVSPTKSILNSGPKAGSEWWKAEQFVFYAYDENGNEVFGDQ